MYYIDNTDVLNDVDQIPIIYIHVKICFYGIFCIWMIYEDCQLTDVLFTCTI